MSPGVVPYFKRKLEIFPCFANHLAHHGFIKTVYPNNKRLYAVCSELIAVFKRWAMAVTEDVMMRKMEEKATRQYEIKLMLRVWYSMKMVMTPEETYEIRKDSKPFLLKRIDCDLDQIKKRFISRRRKNLLPHYRSLQSEVHLLQQTRCEASPFIPHISSVLQG